MDNAETESYWRSWKMRVLNFFENGQSLKILCLGAHADDIEVGCGGTLLKLTNPSKKIEFHWVVFSADRERKKEATKGANAFTSNAKSKRIEILQFRDSYFPSLRTEIKDRFEELKTIFVPDLIFTHYRSDAHQDHRLISELTWNTFRDHLILEYEVPKYDGDFGSPNLYVHLSKFLVQKKMDCILRVFETQKEKQWFSEETLKSVLSIRGMESNSLSKYAEAFYCRKIIF